MTDDTVVHHGVQSTTVQGGLSESIASLRDWRTSDARELRAASSLEATV
jgi:hypothetical protein